MFRLAFCSVIVVPLPRILDIFFRRVVVCVFIVYLVVSLLASLLCFCCDFVVS